MNAPNPRSLGDSYPADKRSVNDDADEKNAEKPSGRDAATQGTGDASTKTQQAETRPAETWQDFQNPMTEDDTASGGPAD